jgi:hypothetical protein
MNIKIIALGGICVLALAGCGKLNRTLAHYRGWSEICIHGVQYLQFSSGASVEYTPDGHVKNCQ